MDSKLTRHQVIVGIEVKLRFGFIRFGTFTDSFVVATFDSPFNVAHPKKTLASSRGITVTVEIKANE